MLMDADFVEHKSPRKAHRPFRFPWVFSCLLGKLIVSAGSIPKELGHLSNLETLRIKGTKLTGNGIEMTCVMSFPLLRANQFECRKGGT